jgi:hypothetical protein
MQDRPTLSLSLSAVLALQIDAELKQCYRNAMLALRSQDWLQSGAYVEGFAVSHATPIPIDHGWLLYEGRVVDPTAALWKDPETTYFPCKAWSYKETNTFWFKPLPYIQTEARKNPMLWSVISETMQEALAFANSLLAER